MPARPLISVLLPAPLSPTSAVTLPARIDRSTSRRTWTGPKLLFAPLSASRGWSLEAVDAGACGAVIVTVVSSAGRRSRHSMVRPRAGPGKPGGPILSDQAPGCYRLADA